MRPGDPDGHGRYARLDVDDDGRLICHECGRTWLHLSTHVAGAHGLTSATYRERHGLARTARLVAEPVRARMRDSWEQHRALHLAALDDTRDIRSAQTTSLGVPAAPATTEARMRQAHARRGRDLAGDELDALGPVEDVPGWTARVRALLADRPDLTLGSLTRAYGMSSGWAHQRLRRYPEQ